MNSIIENARSCFHSPSVATQGLAEEVAPVAASELLSLGAFLVVCVCRLSVAEFMTNTSLLLVTGLEELVLQIIIEASVAFINSATEVMRRVICTLFEL